MTLVAPQAHHAQASAALLDELRVIVGEQNLIADADELLVYECDGYLVEKSTPDVVVFPTSTEQVVRIVQLCNRLDIPFVPRGAGTSLTGGTLAVGGGVMICMTRMKRIIEINVRDRYAIVEPGVVNIWLTRALAGTGFHYAPDPSSQTSCTLGGNIATNSGGPHTLKYGVTVNHVLGLELVLPDGSVVRTGGIAPNSSAGFDLTSLIVGSEGTFGIVTQITLALTRDPEAGRTFLAVYNSIDQAAETISNIIAQGIIPAALEMVDKPMLQAIEQALHFGFPTDAAAVLIIELDGLEAGLEAQAQAITDLVQAGGGSLQKAIPWRTRKEPEYMAIWKSRKSAFGAIGRLSPTFCTQDGVVPRTKLPQIMRKITEIGAKYNLTIANVFHAGDGNIHPILLYDEKDPDQLQRVLKASDEILEECVELGGTVTGEHGIGVEKIDLMPKMYNKDDLDFMTQLRDLFNPQERCSPKKLLPSPEGSISRRHPGHHASA